MLRSSWSGQTLGMASSSSTALCAALPIEGAISVPEWLHLLPTGAVRTNDGRGPYRAPGDAAALMAASLSAAGGKLVLDENHATDLAAPKGGSAPARAWIVELQQRADGIWGRVEWTPKGRQLMEEGEYRGISPVIAHKRDGTITAILRASLTNTPNLQGLTALHSEEQSMDFRKMLIEALGLDGEADDAAIAAAIKDRPGERPAKDGDVPAALQAAQAAIAPIAAAVGLAGTADPAAVLAGVKRLKAGDDDRVTALQSELASVTTSLNAIEESNKRSRAVAFVDGAIAAGRVGVKPSRDEYVSMHMEDPTRCEKVIGNMPILGPGATLHHRQAVTEPEMDDPTVISAHAAQYQRKLADGGVAIDFATAVNAVMEGKHK